MKKLFLLLFVLLSNCYMFAEVEQGWRIGPRANVGASNVLGDGDRFSISYGAGCIVECNVNPHFFVQTGLGIDMLSHKENYIDGNINALYLDLPINVGYRVNIEDDSSFFIQAGPSFACGVWGSEIQLGYGYSLNYFDLMERIDIGLGGRLGFEFSKIQISAGATYGVIPASSGYNNFNVNVRLAYLFNL